MAEERVTISGDLIDDDSSKEEDSASEAARESFLLGTLETKSEPVETCFVDGQFKAVIKEKGSLMSKTWTELFSLMNQYEAELLTKNGEIGIREAKLQREEKRLNLSALKSSEPSPVIAVLQQDNVEKDEKVMTYMNEINSLEKELAELRNELQLKDFHIQTLEKKVSTKDTKMDNKDERIKVLDQRILDLTAEVKNKDFVISQMSKQVRSMVSPGGNTRSGKRSLPLLTTSATKVLRSDDSAISLRPPRQASLAATSQKSNDALSSEDSAEDEAGNSKDPDFMLEGGAESVDDDFDNQEPEPSTSDELKRLKSEQSEESGFEVSMAKYQPEAKPGYLTMPYPIGLSRSQTGSPVVYPKEPKKNMTIVYHQADLSSPTMTSFTQALEATNTSNAKYHVPDQQCITSTGIHVLERLPPTKRRKYSQKRCRICYRQGRRRETTTYCPRCPSNPGLCAGACFEAYHTFSRADYEVNSSTPPSLSAEDEAKSSALLDQSNSLLDGFYAVKKEPLDSSYNENDSNTV